MGRKGTQEGQEPLTVNIQRSNSSRITNSIHAMRMLLSSFMEHVMVSMMGYVQTSVILHRILEHHSADLLGDFRWTIMSVFGSYGYEQTILRTANGVVNQDTHRQLLRQQRVIKI